ncbi:MULTISPECIES: type VI secretion system membrane subunit TssM [Stappiaceae]|jgi:type VI secretion system protein ImpL|uniref:type VI secretion system membrane subunit TssM n=1 Tax=Stappiaceae TaxID=2821832 RepID=UPI0012690F2F|nr:MULTISPECIES: type VI secretion system membrane subunit TssM [Stappiaceae]MBN8180970.1 type VI secretion system membrane subunit TssM [Roseibium aggregatum]QFT69439.1 Intracellular multiplication and macrophage-killing protein [Labrenzia sp. THAF35]UES44958.1 type VI secretion system membrane subunit TssM [Roseibium aggregatum]UES51235.1 type VI secretion system membrane subunit TssM [Roseibium aggregatum]
MKFWLGITAIVIGILALIGLIWFGGPFLSIAGVRPFEPLWVRLSLVALVLLTVGGWTGYRIYKRVKANRELESEILQPKASDADLQIMSERMKDALKTLKTSSGNARTYLYDLPWYLMIGPPGAGKTTALMHSGLKFAGSRAKGEAQKLEGLGGTRYCDWWFAETAVLIDTAGRYTTQDSDEEHDREAWHGFLNILRKARPRQPINGVMVSISLEDLMTLSDDELKQHSDAIRTRLIELYKTLKIDFPVYVIFTKADTVAGFMEFFGSYPETRRNLVWGATFQTREKTKNMVSEAPAEFDLLVERLNEEMADRLQEEPDPRARLMLYGFPTQVAALKDRLTGFLNAIFEPSRYYPNAVLRGFYFTSGTQKGTAIDRVIGSMSQAFGTAYQAAALSGQGKSYFLRDLLSKVIIGEAGWVTHNRQAVRVATATRIAAYAAIALVTLGLGSLWGISYLNNKALIDETAKAVDTVRVNGETVLAERVVRDDNLADTAYILSMLRGLPAGYDSRDTPTPVMEQFGLSQRDRLEAAGVTSYRSGLERLLRPRLLLRIEEQMTEVLDNRTGPGGQDVDTLYNLAKLYRMVAGDAPEIDKEQIKNSFRADFLQSFPGPQGEILRNELNNHVAAMLDLDFGGNVLTDQLDGILVAEVQRELGRVSLAERGYALLKSRAKGLASEDWIAEQRGGSDMETVFETENGDTLDTVAVDKFFTYPGFHLSVLPNLAGIREELERDKWVFGDVGEADAFSDQYQSLPGEILALYTKDFIEAWEEALGNLKFKSMRNDKPLYTTLQAVSAPTSPVVQLLESIRRETLLTQDLSSEGLAGNLTGGNAQDAGTDAAQKIFQRYVLDSSGGLKRIGLEAGLQAIAPGGLSNALGTAAGGGGPTIIPGKAIEDHFRPYHVLVEGENSRKIDALLLNFKNILDNLLIVANNPLQSETANSNVQIQASLLRSNATRFPPPFDKLIIQAAKEFDEEFKETSITQLNEKLSTQVVGECRRIVARNYPFENGRSEVPMTEFAKLFAPTGIMQRFFDENLKPLVDTSTRPWNWKPEVSQADRLSNATLRQFERADLIKQAFFPTGNAFPSVGLQVVPRALSQQADAASLEVNGNLVLVTRGPGFNAEIEPLPANFDWPSNTATPRVVLVIQPEVPGYRSRREIHGDWAFYRFVRDNRVSSGQNKFVVRETLGGRQVAFTVTLRTNPNPFFLSAVGDFSCPTSF